MKVKELKGKYGRPNWNPTVEITFTTTKCMAVSIEEAVQKLKIFVNGDDFITSALRRRLDEYGIKHLLERPQDTDKR